MIRYLLLWIGLFMAMPLLSQIPRNAAGQFEYAQSITQDNTPSGTLLQRAQKFFSRPMLVHWDSVYTVEKNGSSAVAGNGYVEIGLSSGLLGSRVRVPLQYIIMPGNNSYQYSIRQMGVKSTEKGMQFPLEEKPQGMKSKHYDQLINRTHRYLQRVIGYMKREMNGFE